MTDQEQCAFAHRWLAQDLRRLYPLANVREVANSVALDVDDVSLIVRVDDRGIYIEVQSRLGAGALFGDEDGVSADAAARVGQSALEMRGHCDAIMSAVARLEGMRAPASASTDRKVWRVREVEFWAALAFADVEAADVRSALRAFAAPWPSDSRSLVEADGVGAFLVERLASGPRVVCRACAAENPNAPEIDFRFCCLPIGHDGPHRNHIGADWPRDRRGEDAPITEVAAPAAEGDGHADHG